VYAFRANGKLSVFIRLSIERIIYATISNSYPNSPFMSLEG